MSELRFKLGGHIAVLLIMTISARAQPGMLDPSFAGTGMLLLGFGGASSIGKAVTVQGDGKIVMAGTTLDGYGHEALVARFGTNNLLDPTFGLKGVARVPFATPAEVSDVAAVAVQSDGKIVVAGTEFSGTSSGYDFFVARLNSDGSLDATFGNGGTLDWDFGAGDTCNAMVLQGDGKIVVAGFSQKNFSSTYTNYMVLARCDTNGVTDPSFANNGAYIQTVYSMATSMALEGDGNILIGGQLNFASGVFRFTTNGAPDTSFGSGGEVILPSGSQVSAVALQPGGISVSQPAMILAAGTASANATALVARMSLAGVLDTGFNGTGVVTQSVNASALFVTGVMPRITGFISRVVKVVISGYVWNGAKDEFMAARFNNNGSPDTSFGTGGVVITSLSSGNDQAYGLAQPGGALLLAGTSVPGSYINDFSLARYNGSDGSLDTNFNGTGILNQQVGNLAAQANSVAIQADGKIVVVGNGGLTCRLNPDGSLDPAFGNGGQVGAPIGSANAVAIQRDGRIVIAGGSPVMVARFLSNGIPDSSFATTGSVTTVVGTGGSSAFGVAVQSDGKIVVGASCSQGGNDVAVVRYNPDGSLDTDWNRSGMMFTSIVDPRDQFSGVVIQADGKIVASGYSILENSAEFSTFRCDTNGPLDAGFGNFGRVATQVTIGGIDFGIGLALQPDARIVLAGTSLPDVAVIRYTTTGSLDSTFGNGGKVTFRIGFGDDFAFGVGLQKDGKIVLGCRSQVGPLSKFAAARLLSNGMQDTGYGIIGANYFDFGTGADENVNAVAVDPIGRMVMVGTAANLFAIVRVTGDTVLRINSITRLPNRHIFLQGIGVPDGNHTLQSSSRLGPANFASLGPVTADASGAWQYEDATAPGAAIRFYRLSYP